ncbi:MAG: hypothetical protein ACYC5T_10025 [Thiobacillus sp.]
MILKGIRRILSRRRSAYKALFVPGPAYDIVMQDLAKFCRATTTPAVISPLTQQIDQSASFIAIGRQEVFHRISQHINITDADLYRIVNQESEGEGNEYE